MRIERRLMAGQATVAFLLVWMVGQRGARGLRVRAAERSDEAVRPLLQLQSDRLSVPRADLNLVVHHLMVRFI